MGKVTEGEVSVGVAEGDEEVEMEGGDGEEEEMEWKSLKWTLISRREEPEEAREEEE